MYKKFFWIPIILSFFLGVNDANGMESRAPGAEEWKDSSNKPAPAVVRKAADNLWQAVEKEGEAAFDAGWGISEKEEVAKEWNTGLHRCLLGLCTCGISECSQGCGEFCCKPQGIQYDKFYFVYDGSDRTAEKILYNQRAKEAERALNDFIEIVNTSVLKPEEYSGDAKFCEFGPWTLDNRWVKRSHYISSARRDLVQVPQSTRDFVNAHGGWNISYGSMADSISIETFK